MSLGLYPRVAQIKKMEDAVKNLCPVFDQSVSPDTVRDNMGV
jgi:hypothetical protein